MVADAKRRRRIDRRGVATQCASVRKLPIHCPEARQYGGVSSARGRHHVASNGARVDASAAATSPRRAAMTGMDCCGPSAKAVEDVGRGRGGRRECGGGSVPHDRRWDAVVGEPGEHVAVSVALRR
jgi:hypothetical protein